MTPNRFPIVAAIIYKNPQEAFEKALKSGRLQHCLPMTEPRPKNIAAHYMYMGTDDAGKDLFKNVYTRLYLD